MTQELITSLEGPHGTAEIFEVIKATAPETAKEAQQTEYEVRFRGQAQVFRSLGEAYIAAGELSGVPT